MKSIHDLFENTDIYEFLAKKENIINDEKLPYLCLLLDGVVDIDSLNYTVQSLFVSKPTIIHIYGHLFFILIKNIDKFFKQNIKKQLELMHYEVFSFFMKKSLAKFIISKFKIDPNCFYIYSGDIVLNNQNDSNSQLKDYSNSTKNIYKFSNLNDLIQYYIKLIKEKETWPFFAILPKLYLDENVRIIRIPNYTKCFQAFSPLKSLYYFSFIEKNQIESKRIINANEIYSLNHVDDVQINHLYNENPRKPYYLTIRTFLGFLNKFQCLYAFEHFINMAKSNKNFTDFQLLSNFQFFYPKIKHNLFYLEVNSFLCNNQIVFSMDYNESFHSDGLTYFGFDNFNDFYNAKQTLKLLSEKNSIYLIKKLKLIEKDDFSKLFIEENSDDMLFFMFQMTDYEEKQECFLSFLKEFIIIKRLTCSIDNEQYIVVGFKSNIKRQETFLSIKNSLQVAILNEYIPDQFQQIIQTKDEIKSSENDFKEQNMDNKQDDFIVDINDYLQIDQIGKGGFGFVYKVENKFNHKQYAAKVKSEKKLNNNDILQEIDFYKKFKYPLIISFHGYSKNDFEGKNNPVILLEYMSNGSLEQNLEHSRKSSFNEIFKHKKYIIVYGLARVMEFLHSKGVFHRDLKPGNILLDDNLYPRLCDFGLSLIVNNKKNKRKGKIGTIKYMAPEIIKEKDCNTSSVDVYSFSLIAYELLTGKDFFNLDKYIKVQNKLLNDVIKGVRPDLSIINDEEILVFFQRCWSGEPSERPTFSEICETLLKKKFQLAYEADELEILKFNYWFNDNLEGSKCNLQSMQQAESQENIELMVEYANRLYLGIGVPSNKEEAFRLFKKGIDHKNINAMYYLGHYLTESNIYLKNAADLGHKKAIIEYGKRLYDEKNKNAVFYIKKSIDLGNDEGMFLFGMMLLLGKGIKMNKKEASEYFQLAADHGNVKAMFEFAHMLHYGDGIDINYEKASEYYKMAAFYGNVKSITNLGLMLKDGKLPVDLKESAFYLKKAANLGDYDAMYHYGNLLCVMALIGECEYETETEKNYKKAAKYFKAAADAGNIEAGVRYGALYTKKLIYTDDYEEPIKYLRDAAYKGNNNGIVEYLSALKKIDRSFFSDYDKRISCFEHEVFIKKLIENGYPRLKTFLETSGDFANPLDSFIKGDHCFDDVEDEYDDDYDENNLEKNIGKKHSFSKNELLDVLSLFQYTSNDNDSDKLINEVEVNEYESFQLDSSKYYAFFSYFSISLEIQNEIDNFFHKFQSLEKKQTNICHPNDPNDLYTFYFFPPHFHNFVQSKILKIMKKSNFQCYFSQSFESVPFKNYLYFNESLIPENYLDIFFKKLGTIQDIVEIKRNIFDGKQIVTYIIVKEGTEKSIIQSIRNFLLQHKILFKTFVYPLQNNIIINEKIMFKSINDLNIILKEIKSIDIKPIYVQRNILFLYDFYSLRKLFERFTFICFQNEIEKMEVINHLNPIIFANKNKKYVEYDINFFYASINEHIFSERVQKFIPEIFKQLKGFKNIQRNVVSIESPFERTYIGFDTLRHLKKAHIHFMNKIKIVQVCDQPKFFYKKKGNIYLIIHHDLDSKIEDLFKLIACFSSDFQDFCTEINEKNEVVYKSYFGYSAQEDIEKAKYLLNNSKLVKQNKITFNEYNEVNNSFCIDEPRESYLFYDCL